MSWLIPSTIIATSGALMISAVFFYLYQEYQEYYIKIWTITALGFALGLIFVLLSAFSILPGNISLLGEEIAYLCSSLLLLKGFYHFLNQKYPKWLTYICIIIGAWIAFCYIKQQPSAVHILPAFIFIAIIFLQAGVLLFRNSLFLETGGMVVGWSLVIAGFNLLSFPFVRHNPLYGSWVYLLAAVYTMAMAIGILLLYFQQIRRDLSQSEARYRFMAENARDIVYHLQIVPVLKYEFISAAVTEITGYTPDEHYIDPNIIFKMINPDYVDVMKQIVRGIFDFSKPVTMPWVHKDGYSLWLEQHIHPVTDNYGKIIALEGIIRNVTERVTVEEELKLLSLRDSMTGLFNRTFFEQACRNFDTESHNPLGIIVCDVDGLKLINDSMGHDAGDSLLVAATRAIKESFREGDVLARIGGDEFAVLLPKTSNIQMETAVKRIEASVQRYNNSGVDVHLSISIGFALRNDSTISITDLFKNADNNMYREKLYRSQSARSTIVNTLMKALEARDFITEGHTERLQESVIKLATAIGFPENRLTDIRLLAQFHDIGKVGIPDHILFKPGKLTPEEMWEMQRHSEIGYRIAQASPDLAPIADWILRHHEWWNGAGYPLKLKGEEIPLECRILAIVDAYDAMTNDRPYRKSLSPEEAVLELKKGAGIQFAPYLVEIFIKIQKEW